MTQTFEPAFLDMIDRIDDYLARHPGPGVADVRAGIARWRGGVVRHPEPAVLDINRHMAAALAYAADSGEPALAASIAALEPQLRWINYDHYPRDLIGDGFATGHIYVSLIGPNGCIEADDYELGLFLIAPGVLYRDHKHAAPELYAPLTGPHGWRFAPGVPLEWRDAHRPVWNEPFQHHATRVGDVPFLCIFGWTRDVREIATVIPCDDWDALEKEPAISSALFAKG